MAKCTLCNSRKGKRKCEATKTFICSLCCGESRDQDRCGVCLYYEGAEPKRNYREVPFYSIQEMADFPDLMGVSNVIESTLCRFHDEEGARVTDRTVSRIVELIMDKHYFKDKEFNFSEPLSESGYKLLAKTIQDDLSRVPEEKLVKVSAAIYRSIQRRTNNGSEYLKFVHQFVGTGVAGGLRLITR